MRKLRSGDLNCLSLSHTQEVSRTGLQLNLKEHEDVPGAQDCFHRHIFFKLIINHLLF